MTAAAGLELLLCSWAFWQKDGARYRRDNPRTTNEGGGRTTEAMKNKVTWMCAGFFFCVSTHLAYSEETGTSTPPYPCFILCIANKARSMLVAKLL